MKFAIVISIVLFLTCAAGLMWFLDGSTKPDHPQRPQAGAPELEWNDEFATALGKAVIEAFDSVRDAPINIELSRLLDYYDRAKDKSSAVANITTYLEDDSNELPFVVNIRSHPKILGRLFSIYKATPHQLTEKASLLVHIASKCLFAEAEEFLKAIHQDGVPGLRSKAGLALVACQLQRSDIAWRLKNEAFPMDTAAIEEFEWCDSDAVADNLRSLDVFETRQAAFELAKRLIMESSEEEYSRLETIAEYGEKLIAFHSSVGANTKLSDLAGFNSDLQKAVDGASTSTVTVVALQFDYFEREPEEQVFFTALSTLAQLPDVNVFCVSTRTREELEHGLPANSLSVLRCLHDEDGELWHRIGSNIVCMTCVYDQTGTLRFRADAYSSVAEIQRAIAILTESPTPAQNGAN